MEVINMALINWDKYIGYEAEQLPPAIRPILFLHGTHYEMGVQYGKTVSGMIKRNFCLVAGDVLARFSREEVEEKVQMFEAHMAEITPEIKDLWKGIGDGAGLDYWDIAMINFQLRLSYPGLMCSTVGAFGSATKEGEPIIGVNADVTFNMSGYGVTLIIEPDKGHLCIVNAQLAGQTGSNFAMNEKGLVITLTGGEHVRKEDTQFGYADQCSLVTYLAMSCDNADDAQKRFSEMELAGGWIFLFADETGRMMITEHTSAMERIRFPGDHGEKDYLLAANHFLDEEMRVSSKLVGNEDSYYRFETEKKLIEGADEPLTVKDLMDILGSRDYWDGTAWHFDAWGEETCMNTPEMRAPDFRIGQRCFALPKEKTAYIMQCGEDRFNAFVPEATGQYSKIALGENMLKTVALLEENACHDVWEAGHTLSDGKNTKGSLISLLDQAKASIWRGKNHQANARILQTNDMVATRDSAEKAANEFQNAYVKAQIIIKIAKEG